MRTVVEARFAERLTLDDLARETGFSKFYLERSFNERFGLPIDQFLKRVRIARALALLRRGERPASVARAVGLRRPAPPDAGVPQRAGLHAPPVLGGGAPELAGPAAD